MARHRLNTEVITILPSHSTTFLFHVICYPIVLRSQSRSLNRHFPSLYKAVVTRNDFVNDIVNGARADAIFAMLKAIVDVSYRRRYRYVWHGLYTNLEAFYLFMCKHPVRKHSVSLANDSEHARMSSNVHLRARGAYECAAANARE